MKPQKGSVCMSLSEGVTTTGRLLGPKDGTGTCWRIGSWTKVS